MPGSSSRGPQGLEELGRYAGLGLQFASTMAVLGALGWWLDRRLGTLPWLLVLGVVVGAIGGFVRIVKSVPGPKPSTPRPPPLAGEPQPRDPRAEQARASPKERAE